jgi:hypothetical protein
MSAGGLVTSGGPVLLLLPQLVAGVVAVLFSRATPAPLMGMYITWPDAEVAAEAPAKRAAVLFVAAVLVVEDSRSLLLTRGMAVAASWSVPAALLLPAMVAVMLPAYANTVGAARRLLLAAPDRLMRTRPLPDSRSPL